MNLKYKALAIVICFFSISFGLFATLNQEPYRSHTVSKGETVFSISRTYNVPVSEIFTLNPQVEKGLQLGETLKIPAKKPLADEQQQYLLHSIQAKETLYSVSKHYNVSIDDILAANEGLTADNFRIGRVVRIPKSSVVTATVEQDKPVTVSVPRPDYIIHKVQSKETLFGISQRYNVTVEELATLNPELKNSGLEKDMMLRIPFTGNQQPVMETEPTESTTQPNYGLYPPVPAGPIRIGLLLPFLDTQEYQQTRFVEYYEGFLLAVEEMKAKGVSIDVYVFDIHKGKGINKLESLLGTYEMKNLDFIIGGVSDDEVTLLSEFSKENNIGYAVPFPIKNTQAVKNPEAFLSNVSSSFLNAKVAANFVKLFAGSHVIILEDEDSKNNDKQDFISLLKNDMNEAAIINTTVSVNARFSQNLRQALLPGKKNILVPASSSLMGLSKIIPAVRALKLQNSSWDLTLFGYPDWQTYSAQFLEDFYNTGAYIFSSFFVDNMSPATQQFMNKFRSWYGKTLLNTYPKYGILGYDTGLYFLTALAGDRRFFDTGAVNINVPAIQSAFYFDKYNGEGYVNTGLYFVHYRTDMTIEKNDYSK